MSASNNTNQRLPSSKTALVLGLQWGDEGKGKLVDVLANDEYEICARFNGGANAGHTVLREGRKYALHQLPSGVLSQWLSTCNVLGDGVVLDLDALREELRALGDRLGKKAEMSLSVSSRAHVVLPFHKLADGAMESARGAHQLGTTRKGIGPAYADKMRRTGVRVTDVMNDDEDVLFDKLKTAARGWQPDVQVSDDALREMARRHVTEHREFLRGKVIDCGRTIQERLKLGATLLAEGANATHLDVDQGTYPFVTSSSTVAAGACTGLGVPPALFADADVIGIVKAYLTRVGEGPFPTELGGTDVGKRLRDVGKEYGATTGRPRRCGWLDLVQVRESVRVNGVTSINLTKLDVLSGLDEIMVAHEYMHAPEGTIEWPTSLKTLGEVQPKYHSMAGWQEDISHVRAFDQLPAAARQYVLMIERELDVPVRWIGVGPHPEDMIVRDVPKKRNAGY